MSILIYPFIVVSINALLFYRNYQEEESKTSILQAQLAESQLRALKMQLHPHFLFNTLHSISSLVLDEPLKANEMISRLGDFLRMTLENSEEQTVTLGEELEFLRCYLEIEQIRFHDRLRIYFEIAPETLSFSVPHLVLQPIVENAVKHGIEPSKKGGRILISSKILNKKLCLQIKDNGIGMNEHFEKKSNSGKGLEIVRKRLKQFYEDECRLEIKNELPGVLVNLTLPLQKAGKSES